MLFVIFHGAFGSPEGNWFPDLKERLEGLGQQVLIPTFTVEDWDVITHFKDGEESKNQTLENWFTEFEKHLPTIQKAESICFVGHSLGPLFILHVVSKYNLTLDSAIFVSPFLRIPAPSSVRQIDIVNKSFYKTDFDFETLKKQISISYVLYSDNDPYVHNSVSLDFASKLGSASIYVKKAGHMNSEVNLNEFPLVYELCKTRLDLTLYQRYLEHRRELFAVEYLKNKTEEEIYLNPDEVQFEGIFHFRNLRKQGFATFYTGTTFWDAKSQYMTEARKAARRVKDFKRVFIVDKPSSLKRPEMIEQIKLDFESGIAVYLCSVEDVVGSIGGKVSTRWELDFGLWDDDYVCFVPKDKDGGVTKVRLSSKKEDLENAKDAKEKILKKARKIESLDVDLSSLL